MLMAHGCRRLVVLPLALVVILSYGLAFASGTHSGSHSSRSSKAHSSRPKKNKPVHVRGYTRKDGTYVAPHDRSLSGTATARSTATTSRSYRKNYIADGHTAHASVQRDKHGKIHRSEAAKASFERQSPCPATGRTSGRCPGYVVDHVRALECGGEDAPSNMQWQTTADAKAKDRTERLCR
jgi:hypothetical protein